MRIVRPSILALAAAVALVACDPDPADPEAGAPEEGPEELDPEGELLPEEDELDVPDPEDQIEDGAFRGEGVIVPAVEGFTFDGMALAQGLVLASSEDGTQQLAGQAVDTDEFDEPLDVDTLIEANMQQFPDAPSVDEEVELEGADRAHHLRFDDVPPQAEGQPDSSVLILIATDGDGRLAVFNYAAPTADFDDAVADQLLAGAGFDPDSDPMTPEPMPEAP